MAAERSRARARLMKILWVKADFLHPTGRGGQIRTLEMLRRLHRRHEIHYVGFTQRGMEEGPRRANEYSSFAYPIKHNVPPRRSLGFVRQLAGSVFSTLPLSITRYRSREMERQVRELVSTQNFDSVVCDFVVPALNIPFMNRSVLFQHNVETMIWRRHAQTARHWAERVFFRSEARRIFRYETEICHQARHNVTVSETDSATTQELFGLSKNVSAVPTGVDCEYFAPPAQAEPYRDLIFVGAMDWMPNIDGMKFFVEKIWPRLRSAHPGCTLGIVGRSPTPEIRRLADLDPSIHVTGTVPDVRPYLWGSRVSIVPLRIGGGTRLKIYEAMAAGVPVVSTAVGAEGLPVHHPDQIRLADRPEDFADECSRLLSDENDRRQLSTTARDWVIANCSWDAAVERFEQILERSGKFTLS
jgi:sugar transferase (PEP-CTERM/EpsH1 system associated)